MKRHHLPAFLLPAFLGLGAFLYSVPASTDNIGLDALDGLVGTWVEANADGNPTDKIISVVRPTASGSVLMEILFPGTDHEMVTMFYTTGDQLMLTHYCGCTNHPIMKASRSAEGVVRFECVGKGENFSDCATTQHMHDAVYRFDGNRLNTTWRMMDGGALDHGTDFHLVRVEEPAIDSPR